MNKEIITKILEAAVQAPSGDNVQPWKFEVSENFTRIKLFNLPEKDDSYYNFNQVASYIAHGAVIENIEVASAHLGCETQIKLFPDDKQPDLVAQIDLSPSEPNPNSLYQAIFERTTNRFPYKRQEVSNDVVEALQDAAKEIDGASLSLVYQKDKINELAKVLKVNDRIVFERKDIHGFLFDKIRWNKKQIEETQDGMPVDVLGLNPIEKLSFPLMKFWTFVKTANYFGLSRIIELKCWWNCRNASILGMVSVKSNDKFAFIQGGRAAQRVWLQSTNEGFAMQPIIGLTLLIYRLKQNKLEGFSKDHTKAVEIASKSLPKQFGGSEPDTLIMGFRIGKGKLLKTKTERKKVF